MKISLIPQVGNETVHCSQGDTNRQWQFELYGDKKIDIVDSPNPTYWIEKGGTEEILPTNTSVPSTSPIKCDIQYTDGLRTDQEFVYRESPTTVDGSAKLKSIYGNTIVWNQLIQNGNFADTSNWGGYGSSTLSVSSNTATITFSSGTKPRLAQQLASASVAGHKVLLTGVAKATETLTNFRVGLSASTSGGTASAQFSVGTSWTDISTIREATSSSQYIFIGLAQPYTETTLAGGTFEVKNVMLIDLTAMFGSGNEPSTVEEFTSLFPLPYYTYETGSLLSFNGTGIKTVGKNLFDFSQFANGTITFENGVLTGTAGQFYTAYNNVVNSGIDLKYPNNTQITISFDARTEQNASPSGGGVYLIASENGIKTQLATTVNNTTEIQHITVTIPSNRHIDKLGWSYGSSANNIWHITNFQVEFGTETSYEPYTSSTTSIPTSTYFPTGMKSAGNAFDELSNNKAITRLIKTTVDGTSKTASFYGTFQGHQLFYIDVFAQTYIDYSNMVNLKSNHYLTTDNVTMDDRYIRYQASNNQANIGRIYWNDDRYTSASAMNTALQSDPLEIVSLAQTPTETNITSATMVTEYGESDFDSNGVVICNEGMSKYSGFHDAKIRVSDGDGDVYSAKFQVHVERKPK